jgi:hypothetical protein
MDLKKATEIVDKATEILKADNDAVDPLLERIDDLEARLQRIHDLACLAISAHQWKRWERVDNCLGSIYDLSKDGR